MSNGSPSKCPERMIWLQWLWLFAVLAAMTSMARLDLFTRGTIVGLRAAGVTRPDIVQRVRKKDGKRPTLRAVDGVLARHREEPAWRGEDSRAGGRPPLLTAKERKLLLNLVLAERGKAKVTVPYCRRRLPFLREVSESTVRRELFAAGFAYLRRRRKTAVPKEFREQRLVYCRWTLRQSVSDLRRYAYTDGTTFYLARGHLLLGSGLETAWLQPASAKMPCKTWCQTVSVQLASRSVILGRGGHGERSVR